MEREDVTAEEIDLNKVAIIANACLTKHKEFFSDFYEQFITPLWRKNTSQDAIIAQTAEPLNKKFKEVSDDLTSYILDPQYSLPEKQGVLALVLGYDDPFLKGNLFNDRQLTIDNLDEEVANYFIEANNACVSKIPSEDPDEEDSIIYGPLGDICADEDGHVSLPIEKLQKLRNEIRQSTNYIREKSKELDEINTMNQDAKDSGKRLTEKGFVVDGNEYHFDIKHEELKFNETYEPKEIKEKNVSLKEYFTKVKDQGQIGACTVFAISSIYEYILKRNTDEEADLFAAMDKTIPTNKTQMSEIGLMPENVDKCYDMKIPENIPVLQVLSKDNCEMYPEYTKIHEDITANSQSRTVAIDGEHCLYFYNLDGLVNEIKNWEHE